MMVDQSVSKTKLRLEKKIHKISFAGFSIDIIQNVTSSILSVYHPKWGKHITAFDQGVATTFGQNICLLVELIYKAHNNDYNWYQ